MNKEVKTQITTHIRNVYTRDDGTFTIHRILKEAFIDYVEEETGLKLRRQFKPTVFTNELVDFRDFVKLLEFSTFTEFVAELVSGVEEDVDPNEWLVKHGAEVLGKSKGIITNLASAFNSCVLEHIIDVVASLGHKTTVIEQEREDDDE